MCNSRFTNNSWLSPEKDLLAPGLGLGKLDELSLLAAQIKSGSKSLILWALAANLSKKYLVNLSKSSARVFCQK